MAGLPNAELFVEWKTGVPMALADTNRSTFMPSGASAAPGLVPTPPLVAGAVLFLREDGTWATPSITVTALGSIPEATIVGRAVGAGAGNPQALTASEATAILNIFVSASAGKKGLVPAPTTSDVGKVLGATGWETPSSGLTKLASVAIASGDATVSINLTSYTAYSEVYIQVYNIKPLGSTAVVLFCQIASNGTTYTSTSYDYSLLQIGPGAAGPTPSGSTGATAALLSGTVGTSGGKGYNGRIHIMDPGGGSGVFPRIIHDGAYNAGAVNPMGVRIAGEITYPASMAIGGVVLFFSGTNHSGGRYAIFGYQ